MWVVRNIIAGFLKGNSPMNFIFMTQGDRDDCNLILIVFFSAGTPLVSFSFAII